MAKLTKEQKKIIEQNENVVRVTDKRILFKAAFKRHFIEEYHNGKGPTQIFREAGFDTAILGSKRIERAAARWRKEDEDGKLGKYRFHGDDSEDF